MVLLNKMDFIVRANRMNELFLLNQTKNSEKEINDSDYDIFLDDSLTALNKYYDY